MKTSEILKYISYGIVYPSHMYTFYRSLELGGIKIIDNLIGENLDIRTDIRKEWSFDSKEQREEYLRFLEETDRIVMLSDDEALNLLKLSAFNNDVLQKAKAVTGTVRIPVAYALRTESNDILDVTRKACAGLSRAADNFRLNGKIPFSTLAKYYIQASVS